MLILGVAVLTAAVDRRFSAQQSELDASERRYQSLIEGVKDYAIIMLTPDGQVATWNAGAERIKGYRAEEIVGQHFSCFYPDEEIRTDKPKEQLNRAIQNGRVEDEGWRVRKDGSRFWADVVITSLWDKTGHLRGFTKIVRGVTERRQAEKAARSLASIVEIPKPRRFTETPKRICAIYPAVYCMRKTRKDDGLHVSCTIARGSLSQPWR